MSRPVLVLISVAVLISLVTPAHAYLDPGTGTMILHAIIGAIAVAGMTARIYWHKLKSLFQRPSSKHENEEKTTSS